MDGKSPWEPVVRAVLEKIDDVIRQRLKAFRDSLDQWLNGILAGSIPDDWPEQLDRFVQETAERGIGIKPHSIDTIARIIESRALSASRSAVQPAARRVHSQIAADGAFVQSVIPSASGPGEAKPPTGARPSGKIRINPGDYTVETQQIIRILGKVWTNVGIGAMRQVREAGALVDGPTGAPLGHGSNALGVEAFVRLTRKDDRTDTAHFRFVSPLFESAHWEFVELNRGQAPEQGAAALVAREKIRHADVMRVRGASSRFQGGMFAVIGGINGIVEGAPMLGTLEVAGGAEQAALAGADLATGEEHRAWSARGIQAVLVAAGVDAETARFLADNGGLLIALGKAAVDAAGTAHAVIGTSTGYRIHLEFDPATLSANGLGGAKIKVTKVAPDNASASDVGKPVPPGKATSPTGLEVTYDRAGNPVQWRWTVGGKGARGAGHRNVDVPDDQHRGHVKAVNEGAGVNPIDDGAPNIVAQTPKVNLSNVKRFENWRVANAQGQEVIVSQMPSGYQRWQIPGKGIDVTFNPQSTARFPDNWFIIGGTFH